MTTDKYRTYARLLARVVGIMLLIIIIRSNAYADLYGIFPAGNVAGNVITFRWSDSTHAPSYTLQIALDAAFTNKYYENTNAPSSELLYVTGFYDDGSTYYWRVIRNDTRLTSATLSFVNGPSAAPDMPYVYGPTDGTHLGGKNGFFYMSSNRAYGYKVTAATDSGFNNIFIDGPLLDSYRILTDKLPGDGSTIYWKAQTWNAIGWSAPSPTISFINDCNMASKGTGGGLDHIDTCSDDYTARNVSYYLLKDISRRANNNPHNHNGAMADNAAIITGLNSDNLRIEAGKLNGTPIVPLPDLDNKWEETTNYMQDAIHAQVYTGNFYDYLLSRFQKTAGGSTLNSFDGSGRSMYNLIKGATCVTDPTTVAYWNPDTWNVHYCKDGSSSYPELAGHEWGHAVAATASTRNSGLDYYGESGALEEAFADWMGLSFKQAKFNSSWLSAPWQFAPSTSFADDFTGTSQIPNYYNGNSYAWNAGVQTNSRLPSTMFYLLAAGGEHPFSKIKVGKLKSGVLEGIGIETAMQIAFRANMQYWEKNVIFTRAATQMSDAVTDHFSHDPNYPNILYQVKNAWAAVGVGSLPQLSVTSSDSNKGTVNNPVKTITINNTQMQYEPVWGGTVTVVANPKPGYVFESWTENGAIITGAPQSYTFQVTHDSTLTANFVPATANNFGTVNVGQSSPPQPITITNIYKPVIGFGQAQLTGTGAADFAIVSDTCSNATKMYNDSCTLQIAFTPLTAGYKEATLSLSATYQGQIAYSASYSLSGNGVITGISVTSSSTTGGTATLSGSQLWGGTATATATPNPGYAFTGWLENGVTVSSATSYSFTVTSTRSLLAMFSSTPPVITATPMSGNFSATPIGVTSSERTFTITNNGLQSLTFSSISLSGVNPTEFGVAYNGCGAALPPNGSCSIRINFTPAASGARTASININTNDPIAPTYVIPLGGYGGTPIMLYKGGFTASYYASVQGAYNMSSDGNEVRLWAADFNESLDCNLPVTTTIRGGYNGNFADKVGKTALQGTLTISSGTVVVDGLQIGGTSYQSALSVVIDTPGSGTITSASAGINCPGACNSTLVYGDMVTLTASPVGDAVFTGWSGGGCSGTGSCTVTMTGDMTITARFSAAKISVAPPSESLGTVYAGTATSPQTITVSSSGTHNLIIGTLSLSGSNATEFTITGDTCSGQTLAPTATCTVQVVFAPASTGAKTATLLIPSNDPQSQVFSVSLNGIGVLPVLSVSRGGTAAGVVASSPAGINCGGTYWGTYSYTCCGGFSCHTCYGSYPIPGPCSGTFPTGSVVSLIATPDTGYTFTGWSGACSGTGACALTMSSDANVTANFDKTPLSTCSANPVKIGGSYYPNIQSAYNSATDNSLIQLLSIDFTESFTADRGISVIMDGGYLCGFAVNPDWTIVHGAPQILNGSVNMQNIQVNQ